MKRALIWGAGLPLFVAIGALGHQSAQGAESIKALALLWVFVPVPLVYLTGVVVKPRRSWVRKLRSAYLGAGAVAVLGTLAGVSWIGSERAIHPAACADLPDPLAYQDVLANAEDVRLSSRDGTRLKGWFVPGDSDSEPTVLLLHGYWCDKREMLPHARMLHHAGYNLLLFDFRNRGESEGDAVTLGFYEREDVDAAVRYLKARSELNSTRIGALGVSQGGASGILSAARTLEIDALAAESTFRSLDSAIGQSFNYFIGLPAFPFAPLTVWIAERRVGIDSSQIMPEAEVAQIAPRPLLLMHGAEDTTISPDDSQAIYEAASSPKDYWLIPGAGHAQGATAAPDEYESRIVGFFDRYLRFESGE